ncbi:Terpene cyclase/mutase family member [Melia azedarach]|uniref:Terpene cyclase/mutase family member n=1 Tax=Melia azedarach TaxID=155640 RepID=A0ACC1Y593_MELAZ|nr:Terpene cyclase/mutase family member [Melia azedarach]
MAISVSREKQFKQTIPPVKIGEGEEITYEMATTVLKRSVHLFSALQSSHGHWPADNSGPLFYHTPVVICLYITGTLNVVFSAEHRKEMSRYIYHHQEKDPTAARTMLVREQESGFSIMAGQQAYHLGERLGFQFLVCLSGLDAIQCLQNFGLFLPFFPSALQKCFATVG